MPEQLSDCVDELLGEKLKAAGIVCPCKRCKEKRAADVFPGPAMPARFETAPIAVPDDAGSASDNFQVSNTPFNPRQARDRKMDAAGDKQEE